MQPDLVPGLDPAGLPGPPWLFHVLLVLTFFLHMIFMNLTLGGTLLAWFSHLRARGRADDPNGVLAGRLMGVNTFAISLAITSGVAPRGHAHGPSRTWTRRGSAASSTAPKSASAWSAHEKCSRYCSRR